MTLAVFTTTKFEITFPTIKIIKTKLKNKIEAEFLTDIMIIYIEMKINTNNVFCSNFVS